MAGGPGGAHPLVVLFHVGWKVAALATYLTAGFTGGGFVVTFVLCLVFLSADFWTVKNVSGWLLLLALRGSRRGAAAGARPFRAAGLLGDAVRSACGVGVAGRPGGYP